MPSTKSTAAPDLFYTITTNGTVLNNTFSVLSVTVNHELNETSSAIITLNDTDLLNTNFAVSESDELIPGKQITITAGYAGSAEDLIFEGVVVMQYIEPDEHGQMHISVTCNSMDEKLIPISPPPLTASPVVKVVFGESMHSFNATLTAQSQQPSVISGAAMPVSELKIGADSTLLKKQLSAIKGSVSFNGSALAKTGKLIELAGVGARFSGDAYISSVSHRLQHGLWETTVKFGQEETRLPANVSISGLPAQELLFGNRVIFSDKDESLLISDLNGNSITLTSSGISIESGKDINLKASGNIMLDAANIEIAGGQDINLSGSTVNTTAKSSITTKSDGTAELSATTTTTVKGAMVMIN